MQRTTFYINMTEIRWAAPIARATAIAESEWKRHLEEARAVFKTCKNVYPRGTELDWTLYSARQGIPSLPANHVLKNIQNCRMVLVPNDQYLRASHFLTRKAMTGTNGGRRTPDHGYPISSPVWLRCIKNIQGNFASFSSLVKQSPGPIGTKTILLSPHSGPNPFLP